MGSARTVVLPEPAPCGQGTTGAAGAHRSTAPWVQHGPARGRGPCLSAP